MCYIDGSLDQYTSTCPMCKVFRPGSARCPHKFETCRNRTLHPRHDVVHFKNAEVQTFNGCGYCKWANSAYSSKSSSKNPGWPGCCRPPKETDFELIPPADWHAVSVVHRTPIPAHIKLILDALPLKGSLAQNGSTRVAPAPLSPTERKSAKTSPTSPVTRTTPIIIPQKSRSSGSPKPTTPSTGGSLSRASGFSYSGLYSAVEQHSRKGSGGNVASIFGGDDKSTPEKRSDRSERIEGRIERVTERVTPPTTVRRHTEGDSGSMSGSISGTGSVHRVPVRRPSLSRVTSTPKSLALPSPTKSTMSTTDKFDSIEAVLSPTRSTSSSSSASSSSPPSSISSSSPPSASAPSPTSSKVSTPPSSASSDNGADNVSVSSKASSRRSGASAASGSTVTSDGGFTDYLSDESEAELQRQAEILAEVMEQNRTEELEFRAARQQLATVGLRPPRTWHGHRGGEGDSSHSHSSAGSSYRQISVLGN